MRAAIRLLSRVWQDGRGVSAIEFVAIGGMMVVLVLGTYDLGNVAQQRIELQRGVHAGGVYALAFPDQSNAIVAAVRAALPAAWTDVTITGPTLACDCLNTTTGATTANTGCSACPNGSILERTVTLTATRPYSAMLFTTITSNSASYVERYQ